MVHREGVKSRDGVEPVTAHNWTILLVGGPSATGKTTLAESLAVRFGLQHIDVDLIYMALRRAFPAHVAPIRLYEQDELYWARPVDELMEHHLEFRTWFCRALEVVVAQQYRRGRPTVIEGTWLSPQFAKQRVYDGFLVDGVHAVFLYEPEPYATERRRRQRANPWDRTFAPEVMRNIAVLRLHIGEEMTREAEAVGLPVLESQPLETLEARALAALGFHVT
jgi:2-phosphoglycerate kinase